jgi:hypothetical protein
VEGDSAETTKNLVDRMPRRIQAVIVAQRNAAKINLKIFLETFVNPQ